MAVHDGRCLAVSSLVLRALPLQGALGSRVAGESGAGFEEVVARPVYAWVAVVEADIVADVTDVGAEVSAGIIARVRGRFVRRRFVRRRRVQIHLELGYSRGRGVADNLSGRCGSEK